MRFVAVLAVLAFGSAAGAGTTTVYGVHGSGTGGVPNGDCPSVLSQCYASIASALAAVPADLSGLGDHVIEVKSSETFSATTSISGITTTALDRLILRTRAGDRAILDMGGSTAKNVALTVSSMANVVIERFEIRDVSATSGVDAIGVLVSSSSAVELVDLEIHEVGSSSAGAAHGIGVRLTNCDGCALTDSAVYLAGSGSSNRTLGVHVTGGSSTVVVANNVLYGFPNNANLDGGVLIQDASGVTIRNNTVHEFNGQGVHVDSAASSVTLSGNIISNIAANAGAGIRVASGVTGFSSDHNCFDNSASGLNVVGVWAGTPKTTIADWRSASSGDASSVDVDPRFFDYSTSTYESRDYHLRSNGGTGGARFNPCSGGSCTPQFETSDGVTSGCIDAGNSAAAYARETSYNGRRVEAGAYGNTAQASRTITTGIKRWIGGSGSGCGSTCWNDSANWNPAGVPTSTDDVVIRATVVANRTIDTFNAAASARRMYIVHGNTVTIGSGASLTLTELWVTGTLQVSGGTLSTGSGVVSRDLAVESPDVLNGRLLVSAGTASVTGDLTVYGSLAVSGGTVDVDGAFSCDHSLALSGGLLKVAGDVAITDEGSIDTSGSGVLRLDGDSAQTLDGGESTLGHLEITASADVTAPARMLALAGDLRIASGGALFADILRFEGTGTLDPEGTLSVTDVVVDGDVSLASALEPAGALTVSSDGALTVLDGAVLTLASACTVDGTLRVEGGGTLALGAGLEIAGTLEAVGGGDADRALVTSSDTVTPARHALLVSGSLDASWATFEYLDADGVWLTGSVVSLEDVTFAHGDVSGALLNLSGAAALPATLERLTFDASSAPPYPVRADATTDAVTLVDYAGDLVATSSLAESRDDDPSDRVSWASLSAVLINEVHTDSTLFDFGTTGFDGDRGAGSVDGADDWIELLVLEDGVDLGDWTVTVDQTSGFSGAFASVFGVVRYLSTSGGVLGDTRVGDRVVLGEPSVDLADALAIELRDGGVLVDALGLGAWDDGDASDNAPNGAASGLSDLCVARVPDGWNTLDAGDDTLKQCCTLGLDNDPDGDADGDGLASCSDVCPGVADPGQADADGDGSGDACDDDRDGDTVANADDSAPDDPLACRDDDDDDCDDCARGLPDVDDDGDDFDGDGLCDFGDPDDDDDLALDSDDSDDFAPFECNDSDGDDCEDCVSGVDAPALDGDDFEGDGLCDLGDPDDDDDLALDADDSDDFDPFECNDSDGDDCEDCVSGVDAAGADGDDFEGDGLCDLGDPDDDDDLALDSDDSDDFDAFVCNDSDTDGCEDCDSGADAPGDDGTDLDGDGACDSGDCDDDSETGGSCFDGCAAFHRDADSDELGDAGDTVSRCVVPAGYVADATDCDDSNAQCGTSCTDDDGDDVCAPADCDDHADTGAGCFGGCAAFYADADGDALGDALVTVSRCAAPAGYVADATDCDDNNATCGLDCTDLDGDATCAAADCDDHADTGASCFDGCAGFYRDADADTLGDAGVVVSRCGAPSGYVADGSDCDDTNARCGDSCVDGDGDDACAAFDCDDSADTGAGCFAGCASFYRDDDGDGLGDALVTVSRCTAPTGYVADGSDCDDTNASCGASCVDLDSDGTCGDLDCDDSAGTGGGCSSGCGSFYRDADGDDLGDADVTTERCAMPEGYVADSGDCDDDNSTCGADCTDLDGDDTCAPADCDDQADTGGACTSGCVTTFADTDGDGLGAAGVTSERCGAAAGWVLGSTDCDDNNATCGLDCTDLDGDDACAAGDCDDHADTGATCASGCTAFFLDVDGDGLGDAGLSVSRCSAPSGYAGGAGDCDDDNAACGADCTDADADGSCITTDCDDDAATGGGCTSGCSPFHPDDDGDGLGDPGASVTRCVAPPDHVADASDCDDTNATCGADCTDLDGDDTCAAADCDDHADTGGGCSSGCVEVFRDADGDGRGDPAVMLSRCTEPAGYLLDASDCDDANATCGLDCTDGDGDGTCAGVDCDDHADTGGACAAGCAELYADTDGDGLGDPALSLVRCAAPAGYVANAGDCDDDNVTCGADCTDADADGTCAGVDCDDQGSACATGCSTFYADTDADGRGDADVTVSRCVAPEGYAADASDCDDDNALCGLDCSDADADGVCVPFDCDDHADTGASCTGGCAEFHADGDGDGLGDPGVLVTRCLAPFAHVANASDCDDGNDRCGLDCTDDDGDDACAPADCDDHADTGGACATGCATFYADTDADGRGDGAVTVTRCVAPVGHVSDTSDCDDANALCGLDCSDDDGDGACPPSDCDDHADTGGSCSSGCSTYYVDADGDASGDASIAVARCSPPAGHVADASDCDDHLDTGATCSSGCGTFHLDADGDGRGDGSISVVRCAAPAGHVADASDCDDDNDRCGLDCTDADGDGACPGVDCDDHADTGSACTTGCSTYYSDADGDGLGAGATVRCTAPADHVSDGSDCDDGNDRCGLDCTDVDADGACAPADCDDHADTGGSCATGCATFYADTDGDALGDVDVTVTRCVAPLAHVADASDCDDDNALCGLDCTDDDGDGACPPSDCDDQADTGGSCSSGCAAFYADADDDDSGDAANALVRCVAPAGHVADASDCDDHLDTGATCSSDCTLFYLDTDADGLGAAAIMVMRCAAPLGHVADANDCDDTNPRCGLDCSDGDADGSCAPSDCDDHADTGAACTTGCSTFHEDTDADGLGAAASTVVRCAAPPGHVADANDCDDTNPRCGLDCTDGDADGTCAPSDCDDAMASCAADCTDTDADGVAACAGDCDDNNAGCASDCTDADADGACSPVDCDDTDADEHPGQSWHPDGDGDGFGDPDAGARVECARPAGHVVDASDCDDSATAIHPGALEHCDGVDSDCNLAPDDEPAAGASCDDGVGCTDDRCDDGGCLHVADDTRCDDHAFCNGAERCDVLLDCGPGASPLDDGVDCTADLCDELADAVTHLPDHGACSDADGCTDDRCDATAGCVHDANTAPCDDADPCTRGDTCGGEGCTGVAYSCDDGEPCTADACDGSGGCTRSDDALACPCGDGVANLAEDCDGDDLRGASCVSRGYLAGSVACGADCALDTSACFGAPDHLALTLDHDHADIGEPRTLTVELRDAAGRPVLLAECRPIVLRIAGRGVHAPAWVHAQGCCDEPPCSADPALPASAPGEALVALALATDASLEVRAGGAGTVTISVGDAELPGASAAVSFEVDPAGIDAVRSEVTVAPSALQADGESRAELRVVLRDAAGNALAYPPYVEVGATASAGELESQLLIYVPDPTPYYRTTLTSIECADPATFGVDAGGVALAAAPTLDFVCEPVDPVATRVSVTPSRVRADGAEAAEVRVWPVNTLGQALEPSSLDAAVTLGTVTAFVVDDEAWLAHYSSRACGDDVVHVRVNGVEVGGPQPIAALCLPVDPALSRLTATPATVPADGETPAFVTVEPLNAIGVRLGAGHLVELTTTLGTLTALTDTGDGLYTATLSSTEPGRAELGARADGSVLDTVATVTFVLGAGVELALTAEPAQPVPGDLVTVTLQLTSHAARDLATLRVKVELIGELTAHWETLAPGPGYRDERVALPVLHPGVPTEVRWTAAVGVAAEGATVRVEASVVDVLDQQVSNSAVLDLTVAPGHPVLQGCACSGTHSPDLGGLVVALLWLSVRRSSGARPRGPRSRRGDRPRAPAPCGSASRP